jgi:hypothetical protein
MVRTTHNDKTKKVGITLPNSLIKQTDKTRGDVKGSTYILRAIEWKNLSFHLIKLFLIHIYYTYPRCYKYV